MELNNLKPAKGSTHHDKRIGRGAGSGHGGTATRGHKGAQSRSGYSRKLGFEGGQMPLYRRLPKRGFTNPFTKEYSEVNVQDLNRFEDGAVVDCAALVEAGVVKQVKDGVKVLGNGEITKKITVKAEKFSKSAVEKIEAAGGKVEVL